MWGIIGQWRLIPGGRRHHIAQGIYQKSQWKGGPKAVKCTVYPVKNDFSSQLEFYLSLISMMLCLDADQCTFVAVWLRRKNDLQSTDKYCICFISTG